MRAGTRVSPRASTVFAPRGARAARAAIFVPSIPRAAVCGPGSASFAPAIQSTRPRLAVYARRMPDEADELILKMQHLEAQARAQQDARTKQAGVAGLRTAAQRLAAESQQELAAAEAAEKAAAEKQDRARSEGIPPLDAADLLAQGKSEAKEARTRAVKARARLNFALDRMDEAERREWEALQA